MAVWYVRKSGSNTNGGSSPTVRSTGIDAVTNGTNTVTAASAAWTAADVGHYIYLATGTPAWRKITVRNSATSITVDGATIAGQTGITWTVGGALATPGRLLAQNTVVVPIASGDTVWCGSGEYCLGAAVLDKGTGLSLFASEVFVKGDLDGSKTGDPPGEVILSRWTSHAGTRTPDGSLFRFNGQAWCTFEDLTLISNDATLMDTFLGAHHITFRRCTFYGYSGRRFAAVLNTTGQKALALAFDACRFVIPGGATSLLEITLVVDPVADYDADVKCTNCLVVGGGGKFVNVLSSGVATGFGGGGVRLWHNTLIGTPALATVVDNGIGVPCEAYGNIIVAGGNGVLAAATSGQIVEDYNLFFCGATPRTNVATGTHSKDNVCQPLLSMGQEDGLGRPRRPWGAPPLISSALGMGAAALKSPPTDLLAIQRPNVAALTACGAIELADAALQETTTVYSGAAGWVIAGPGSQDFFLPVDTVPITVKVHGQYDASHGAANKPRVTVLAAPELGLASDTVVTMTAAQDVWEELALLSNFTPIARGVLRIRALNRAAALSGKFFFDDFTVT